MLARGDEVPDPPLETLSALLDGFRASGGRYVTISGGEPGLRSDLDDLVDKTAELGFELTLFTNGRAATPRVLERLAAAGGRLAVSIDGPEASVHEALRGPGSFAPAMAALERAVCRLGGSGVILSCLISKPVLRHLVRLLDLARGLSVPNLYLGVFEPLGRDFRHEAAPSAEEMVGPVLELLEAAEGEDRIRLFFSESNDLLNAGSVFTSRERRHVLGRTVKVQADGWALPGPFYYDSRFRLGRPWEEGWLVTLSSPVRAELERLVETRVRSVAACRQCFWAGRCGGGSPALTWAAYGAWSEPCPLCELYQATLDRAARRSISRESSTRA